jgi:hypothetical protein
LVSINLSPRKTTKIIAILFYVSDVYPKSTGTQLEAQNSLKTKDVQKLTLENISV